MRVGYRNRGPAETVNYSYDLQGELLADGGISPYLDQAIYSPSGQPQRTTVGPYGEQLVQTYTSDTPTQRLLQTTTNLQTLSSAADTTYYTYNAAGDITSASDTQNTPATSTQCYTYNNLQELTTAWTDTGGTTATTDAGNGTSLPPGGLGACTNTQPATANIGGPAPYWQSYTYDNLGDRLTETSYNTAGDSAQNITQTLTYPGSDGTAAAAQPDAPTAITTRYGTSGSSTTTPAYNSNGQETTVTTASTGASPPPSPDTFTGVTYNTQGQVATTTSPGGTTSYLYDPSGNLMLQTGPGGATLYLDTGTEQLTYSNATGKTTGLRFYPQPDGTVAIRSSATSPATISYETTNPQHTATDAINASTLAITRRYYDPYGTIIATSPTTSTWPDNNAYLGKPQDTTTGLDLLGARHYNPATGSFLSLDPVMEAGNPTQMGGYTYAANSPATNSDPTGLYISGGSGNPCNTTNTYLTQCGGNGQQSGSGSCRTSPGRGWPARP